MTDMKKYTFFVLMFLLKPDAFAAPVQIEKISGRGGRVDWYKGAAHELLAVDGISNDRNQNSDVYTMNPDGSNRQCVTCTSEIPKGFIGQPVWHPDGEHLVVQAENNNSRHGLFNHMAWGIDQDLWIVRKDGTEAERIWESPLHNGALHPHFNKQGTQIIFAEKIATGRSLPFMRRMTPGGENPWDGWQIHIADFDITKHGTDKLSNHRVVFAGTGGMYETHGFTDDGRIVYSHTAGGKAYVDDCYVANADGSQVKNMTKSPSTWEEHLSYSPSGKSFLFISSRVNPDWKAPRSKAATVRTELYQQNRRGDIQQLTEFNKAMDTKHRFLVSDFDWNRDGTKVAFQVAPMDERGKPESPQLWMMTFPEAQ